MKNGASYNDSVELPPSGLRSLDEKSLKPPETRVGSTQAMRARIGAMKREERTRSDRRATIQGLLDGNPPKSRQKLADKGRRDEINFNTREGEGMADAAKTPYYTLTFRQQRFANIVTDYGDSPQRRIEWSEKISARFHEMLKGWTGHDWNVQIRDWQMCVYGTGVVMWEDTDSPFWKGRKVGDVIVPVGALADIDVLPEAAIPREISPVDLYRMVKKEATATARGWFPERVKRAIVNAAPQTMKTSMGDNWSERYQDSLRRGDVSWNGKEHLIPIVDYLVQEFNGKVTHCILLDDGGVGNTDSLGEENDEGLLFKKIGRFDSFSEVLCPFFFDVGTGEWHSVKGLGPKIFDFANASNLITCDLLTGARTGSKLLMQATDAVAMQETQLIDVGSAKVIQPGFSMVQHRMDQNLQGPLAVKRDLQNTLQSNTGQYRQRESADNMEPTLGQAQLNARNQQQLGDAAVDRHMNTLDKQYLEQARRALTWGKKLFDRYKNEENPTLPPDEKLVLRFYKYLVKVDMVPEEALKFENICSVNAVRGIGNGSPVSMDLSTRGMLELMPFANERGRNRIQRMRSTFLVGPAETDATFPPFDQEQLPDAHVAWATMENNFLRMPQGEVVVTPEQDHAIHFGVHFSDTSGDFKLLQQGQGDPMAVLVHAHNAGPHMKEHLDRMSGDPTRAAQLKPMQEGWLTLSKLTDQLQQQVEEHLASEQANQPQAAPDPALIAALRKVDGELQIKARKMEGDMALKAQKQEQTMRLKDLEKSHNAQLKNKELAIEVARTAAQPVTSGGVTSDKMGAAA